MKGKGLLLLVSFTSLAAHAQVLPGAQQSSIRLLQGSVSVSPPPLPAELPEETPLAAAPEPLPTGVPLIVTGSALAATGVSVLLFGVLYLVDGLGAEPAVGRAHLSSSALTGLGLAFSAGGAALIGSGGYLFFRGRAQRAAYNAATAAAERPGTAVFLGYRGTF